MIPTIDWSLEPSVVVIEGSEDFLKEALIDEGIARLSDYVHVDLVAGEDSDHAIRAHLFEGSFIPMKKLLVVREATRVEDSSFLVRYADAPNPDHVLVLVAPKGRLPKWFTSLKCNQTVKVETLKAWEYKTWATDYSMRKGYALSEPLAEAICTNVGQDLYALSNELQKIFLTMGKRRSVEVKDITSVLVQHQGLSPFKVIEAWGARQSTESLKLASIYFHQSSDKYAALPLIAIFLGQIEKLIRFESYHRSEYGKSDICKAMGISPFLHDQLQRQAMHWNLVELREAYHAMCDIESKTKKGQNGELLISWFLSHNFEVAG